MYTSRMSYSFHELTVTNMFQAINNMDRESSYAPTISSYESSSRPDPSRLSSGPSQASSATVRGHYIKRAVRTDKAPPPLPLFSQAIVCQGMVYCSGSIGMSPITKQMVDGDVGDRTAQALNNLSAVLEEAGSSLKNVVKCNVFLSDMTNFTAMNRVYDTFFEEPKPCRTCVAVSELPMKTDVEIECIAHLITFKFVIDIKLPLLMAPTATKRVTRSVTVKAAKSEGPRAKQVDSGYESHTGPRPQPNRNSPTGKRRTGVPAPAKRSSPLRAPLDQQIQSAILQAVPDSLSIQSPQISKPIPPSFDVDVIRASNYFSRSENRAHQEKIEEFFQSFPNHPQTDTAYKGRYQALRSAAWRWVVRFFHKDPQPSDPLDLTELATSSPELMEYITSIFPSSRRTDWKNILESKRAEIVYSILGKALELHVFGQELVGATPDQQKELRKIDYDMMDSDGFSRQRSRALAIDGLYSSTLPPNFSTSLHRLQNQLTALLYPLLPSSRKFASDSPSHPFATPLFTILILAAKLHLDIRRERSVIYYFGPAPAPGSNYDDEDMSILNAKAVEQKLRRPSTLAAMKAGRVKRKAGITGWAGLMAYRAVDHADDEKKTGIHTHTLARADVFVAFKETIPATKQEKGSGAGRKAQPWWRVKKQEKRQNANIARELSVAIAATAGGIGAVGAFVVAGGLGGGVGAASKVWSMVSKYGNATSQ
ncbi:MAG: hypothetical protein Q9181_001191 [Wetmoreana brouardii]